MTTGEADAARDVRVTWVDGTVESFGDFEVRRLVDLFQGEGRVVGSRG